MKTRETRFAATAAALLLCLSAALPAQAGDDGERSDPLALVPEDATLVIGFNARAFFDSEIFREHLAGSDGDSWEGPLPFLQKLTQVDLRKELDSVVLFANNLNEMKGAAIFQGRFDQTRLLEILRSDEDYDSMSLAASEDCIIAADSRALVEQCFAARDNPEASFSLRNRRETIIPRADKAIAWFALAETSRDFRETTYISSIAATVEFQAEYVIARARLQIVESEELENWLLFARLGLEVARNQTVSPEVAEVFNAIRMDKVRGTNAIEVELDLTFAELKELYGEFGDLIQSPFVD